MIFFTANLEFGNDKIARSRHFKDIIQNSSVIISNWNSLVTNHDTVYILGGTGDLEYLKELNGEKYLMFNDKDDKLYRQYIESVSTVRDEIYDKEMYETYLKIKFNISHVIFNKRVLIKLYSGRLVSVTTDYSSFFDTDEYSIVGNIGSYQRMFPDGINADIYVNGMFPLSEVDIEEMIKKMDGKIY